MSVNIYNSSNQTLTKVPGTETAAFTGATSSAAGKKGLVPAPASGAQNKVLQGNGTWGDNFDDIIMDSLAYVNSSSSLTTSDKLYNPGAYVYVNFGSASSINYQLVKVTVQVPQGGTFVIGSNCVKPNKICAMVNALDSQLSVGHVAIYTNWGLTFWVNSNTYSYTVEITGNINGSITSGTPYAMFATSALSGSALANYNYITLTEFNSDAIIKFYWDASNAYIISSKDLPNGHNFIARATFIIALI